MAVIITQFSRVVLSVTRAWHPVFWLRGALLVGRLIGVGSCYPDQNISRVTCDPLLLLMLIVSYGDSPGRIRSSTCMQSESVASLCRHDKPSHGRGRSIALHEHGALVACTVEAATMTLDNFTTDNDTAAYTPLRLMHKFVSL